MTPTHSTSNLASFRYENHLLYVVLKSGSHIDEDAMLDLMERGRERIGGEDFITLVEIEDHITVSKKARELYAAENQTNKKAIAFVVNNHRTTGLINFYISFNSPVTPVKLFSNPTDALEWLFQFMDNGVDLPLHAGSSYQ